MESIHEVALVLANTFPHKGRNIYWMFSRKQVEYILTELQQKQGGGIGAELMKAEYLDDVLSVISLEQHYGLKRRKTRLSDKYIVTRAADADGKMKKVMVHSMYPVRMRPLTFATTPVLSDVIADNADDILGCFNQGTKHLFIIPDLPAIIKKYC